MSSSHLSASPPPFAYSSVDPSTAASSPPPFTDPDGDLDDEHQKSETTTPIEDEEYVARFQRLTFLLEKSAAYSSIIGAEINKKKYVLQKPSKPTRNVTEGRKRLRTDDPDPSDQDYGFSKRTKTNYGQSKLGGNLIHAPRMKQPKLVTGGKLKDYQLEGVEWMISLDQNGISGILADEMGLGKTIQTIAFNAYLRERENFRPFLIVCPLMVLHNWVEEFAKFAPKIPVCAYHGTPAERRGKLKRSLGLYKIAKGPPHPTQRKAKYAQKESPRQIGRNKKMRSVKPGEEKGEADENIEENPESEAGLEDEMASAMNTKLQCGPPVIITTYEMIIKEKSFLSSIDFGYIVVDEGHRLKNMNCKLMKVIKKFKSAGRMLLTGTPLHNNLAELWSLLNFILPDIFNDLDSFQEWFNLSTMQETLSSSQSSQIINALHSILKPFLLRRLKADVENLPPKKEYVLYAPLSVKQRELYDHVLGGELRAFLIGKGKDSQNEEIDVDAPMKLRKTKRRCYVEDVDDDEFFDDAELGDLQEKHQPADIVENGRERQHMSTVRRVNNLRLQHTLTQLRKVCCHPFLFDWPLDPETQQPTLDEDLVNASGKMMVLDRLLGELSKRGHKVLLFSQFTRVLDIIEDWACEEKGWKICRLDGTMSSEERREQIGMFQNGGDSPDAPFLFLLSTRAGGLGINLTAADTVIFYDQDWNPQMDAQAQDRVHRIGQTKPVLIFRLVNAHTVETKIMRRANEKRRLEALVIAKGKFKTPASIEGRGQSESMAEMLASLLKLEAEHIEVVPNTEAGKAGVLSDEDLETLLDRSPEVFTVRQEGWTSADRMPDAGVDMQGKRAKAAFVVFEQPRDEGNAALANMLEEDVEC